MIEYEEKDKAAEIRSLTGPELDATIAEMMGFKLTKKLDSLCCVYKGNCWVAFQPSTSWLDFGLFVQWMESEGWGFTVSKPPGDPAEVMFARMDETLDKPYSACGSTLPEAACRAALLTGLEER